MGCVASKLDINDVHPNMFAVVNVNDVSLKCIYMRVNVEILIDFSIRMVSSCPRDILR